MPVFNACVGESSIHFLDIATQLCISAPPYKTRTTQGFREEVKKSQAKLGSREGASSRRVSCRALGGLEVTPDAAHSIAAVATKADGNTTKTSDIS
jgi:hypothetical protein